MDFSGQVVIVTGGSRGIGRAVVCGLARRGARVIFCYKSRGDAAAETLTLAGGETDQVISVQADVSDPATAPALVDAALNRWGQLDALINCVGQAGYMPIEQIGIEQWRMLLEVNLTAIYHSCRVALRPMMQRRYGRIVNVSALHGTGGFPGQADYSAATGGVLGLTRALAREVAPWSITVNAVAPGFVETEMLEATPAPVRAWGEQIIALRRAGKTEEVAAGIIFLASPLASYITGHTLAIDGGWTMA